ncbi:transposable element Tc3 transposase [Trichonephila clavipes]|nr:transposable element Tc3 transposase [Trichonephila clavipes]
MGLQFLFMDDNAPCHRTVAAEQLLESEDIERMDWPARSPDLNPIEHVWDVLGRRLAARTFPPVTIRELRLALQDEWAAMPQQLIDTLILSMGRRCETCLATALEAKREEFVDDALIYAKSLCEGLEISFEPPGRIRRKHISGDQSKDVQLSYEDDLRRTMFSSIDRVTAEIRE